MKQSKTLKQMMLCIGIVVSFMFFVVSSMAGDKGITILFTHDMHDHFLPKQEVVDGEILERGGYSKLKTLINEEKAKGQEVIVVDGGDFSMGTVFQTIYNTHAPELRLMGQLGYDVVTLGNHEFDFRNKGLEEMLLAATKSGDVLPQIVSANIADVPEPLRNAMGTYGVKPYTILERSGIKIGIFGLMGKEAASNAPMAEVTFQDPIEEAKKTVALLEKEGADLIICLSHSGTKKDKNKSEDEKLAKEVPGIDVIISGHTHTSLEAPIQVGNTLIGSVGENGQVLGKMTIMPVTKGKSDTVWELGSYTLTPITETVADDEALGTSIQKFANEVEANYLQQFGYKAGEVVAYTDYSFEEASAIGRKHEEHRIGNMITDAYKYAIQQAEGEGYEPVDVGIVPTGVIRGSFVPGAITVEEVFEVSSLGIGADGVSGYPLVSAYVTGKELKTICEVDASIAPLMSVAQLYMSGMHYTFNPSRMIFNKVTDAYLVGENGERIDIEDDKLYRIAAGLYSAQMLSVVGDQSFGLLSIVPKDKDGTPIQDFEKYIVYNRETGAEVKEWVALADYMKSFDKVDGVSRLPERYKETEGRKVVDRDRSIGAIISHPNGITLTIYGIVLLIVGGSVGLTIWLMNRRKKRN